MREYLVIDSTGCVNFFTATSRSNLYEQMFEAQIRAVVIREVNNNA